MGLIQNRTEFQLVPYQAENGEYNLISVDLTIIKIRYICVYVCEHVSLGNQLRLLLRSNFDLENEILYIISKKFLSFEPTSYLDQELYSLDLVDINQI